MKLLPGDVVRVRMLRAPGSSPLCWSHTSYWAAVISVDPTIPWRYLVVLALPSPAVMSVNELDIMTTPRFRPVNGSAAD